MTVGRSQGFALDCLKKKQFYADRHLLNFRPSTTPYPVICQPPQKARVDENKTARFSSMITGTPQPIVEWYVNGVIVEAPTMPVVEEPRYVTSFDGLLHHLEVRKCKPQDAGTVTVQARRSDVPAEEAFQEPEAVVQASTTLEVIPAPQIVPQLRRVSREYYSVQKSISLNSRQ